MFKMNKTTKKIIGPKHISCDESALNIEENENLVFQLRYAIERSFEQFKKNSKRQ